ncbi:MAG: hypothetical protein AAF390_04325 [Pseudomonadota bacterium]
MDFADWCLLYIVTVLSPLAGFAVIAGLAWLPIWSDGLPYDVAWFGTFLLYAPMFGIVLVPLGLIACAVALRMGWAGWGTALLLPFCLLATVSALAAGRGGIDTVVSSMAILYPIAAFHAAALWLALRWRHPQAVAPR